MTAPSNRRGFRWRWLLYAFGGLLLCVLALLAVAGLRLRAAFLRTDRAPESATGLRVVDETKTQRTMVVAAHPEAARIGVEILRRNGSALDAAIAVQLALSLVEPQSSGIGGGAFLFYYDARDRSMHAYDGREVAPRAATPALLLDEKGTPLSFPMAVVSGRSVGVPGVLRMLELAHKTHGRLKWQELFSGPIALAQSGFHVTPRLHTLLAMDPILPTRPTTRAMFFGSNGWVLPVGAVLQNPPLADTFARIAAGGADAFYRGEIADDIARTVQEARQPSLARMGLNAVLRQLGIAAMGTAEKPAGGTLSAQDLADYKARDRQPLCRPYRRYQVCGVPPPSGGVSVLELLGLLERFESQKLDPRTVEGSHLVAEAERLVYADRDRWLADPDFVDVPSEGLLDPSFLRQRAALINPDKAQGIVEAAMPPGARAELSRGVSPELPSTSHFVIVDAEGSVACMTTSIEFGFGSHLLVRGFLLNNQLTDFSARPEKDGRPIANAVAPGKRPRSTMSPIVVFDKDTGKPVLGLGSPGGGRILGYVARTLIGILDTGLSPQTAVALPHVLNANGETQIEDTGWSDDKARGAFVKAMQARGHTVALGQQNSGLHVVALQPDGLHAGVDPRREGQALGD